MKLLATLLPQRQPARARPIFYRTHRTWWQRLQPILAWLALIALVLVVTFGTVALQARLQANTAQLDAAFLQGMASGQQTCGRQ